MNRGEGVVRPGLRFCLKLLRTIGHLGVSLNFYLPFPHLSPSPVQLFYELACCLPRRTHSLVLHCPTHATASSTGQEPQHL